METQWQKLDSYTAIRISNYQGTWQIQKGNINKVGEIFPAYSVPTWKQDGEVQLKKKKTGGYLNIPDTMNLGNVKEDALKILSNLYNSLKRL